MGPAPRVGESIAQHEGVGEKSRTQRIVRNGVEVPSGMLGSLARLGLGPLRRTSGDSAKARAAYQDFLTLWKDADRDIPILRQAKTEYAKLR